VSARSSTVVACRPNVASRQTLRLHIVYVLGLGFVVFGLGLMTDFWSRSLSRSRTLWSRSWPWSHYVLVSLTSLLSSGSVIVGRTNRPCYLLTYCYVCIGCVPEHAELIVMFVVLLFAVGSDAFRSQLEQTRQSKGIDRGYCCCVLDFFV